MKGSDFSARAHALLNDSEEPWELLMPDPQPSGLWVTILAAPVWWQRKGLNLVLVSCKQGTGEDYAVLSKYGITFPLLLPPPRHAEDRRVDVYNTGPAVTDAGDLPPGAMLYMQRVADPLPVLPALVQIMSDARLDCEEELLPPSPPPLHMGYALLDAAFGQHPLQLDFGPVSPQVAAVIGGPASDLCVYFQKGPSGLFGSMCIYGAVVNRCLAYRHRSTVPFLDARFLGKPVCSRFFRSRLLRVEDVLEAIDFSAPRYYEARFTGGVPVGGDPLVLRFDHCGSTTVWVVNTAPNYKPSS